ncbi:putative nuclease HARBI1 [Artemia franciscana]
MPLITLWILATPESYRSVGCRFDVCKSTVFRIIRRTIDAIYEMASTTIDWPGATEAQNIVSANSSTAGFPGVLGAIDGTHILIRTPQHSSGTYINRKGFHSLQLQVVCQHNLKFTDCYVGQPGSMHDVRVFRHSEICTDLQKSTLFFPEDSHLIGDAAYPLSDRLLTPYRDTGNLTRYQVRYNFKLSSTRMSVERAIGMLKGRFRRLKFFLFPYLVFICKSIIAACTLHNFCIDENDLHFENSEELSSGGAATINSENNIYNSTVTARAKRDRIARLS